MDDDVKWMENLPGINSNEQKVYYTLKDPKYLSKISTPNLRASPIISNYDTN